MSEKNLIVNYLPPSMELEKFRTLFAPFGPVVSCRIIFDEDGHSLCYGFVNFLNAEDASRALILNGLRIENKRLKVAYALPSHSLNNKLYNLIVRNIPKTMNSLDLHTLFVPYGKIISARVLYDYELAYEETGMPVEKRISRGVGFVLFERVEDAKRAMVNLSGMIFNNGGGALDVKVARKPGFNRKSLALTGDKSDRMIRPEIHYEQGVCLVVNNLNRIVNEWNLVELFSRFGMVQWVKVARNSFGVSRHYAYVHMQHYYEALHALNALNGIYYNSFRIFVSIN